MLLIGGYPAVAGVEIKMIDAAPVGFLHTWAGNLWEIIFSVILITCQLNFFHPISLPQFSAPAGVNIVI